MATQERPQTKPFAQWLQEQRKGVLHEEVSEALATVVSACQEHRKVGTVTLVVKVRPNDDGTTVQVSDEVKAKAPEGDRPAALFFVDDDGNLSRRDPRQTEMPLRDASAPREAESTPSAQEA